MIFSWKLLRVYLLTSYLQNKSNKTWLITSDIFFDFTQSQHFFRFSSEEADNKTATAVNKITREYVNNVKSLMTNYIQEIIIAWTCDLMFSLSSLICECFILLWLFYWLQCYLLPLMKRKLSIEMIFLGNILSVISFISQNSKWITGDIRNVTNKILNKNPFKFPLFWPSSFSLLKKTLSYWDLIKVSRNWITFPHKFMFATWIRRLSPEEQKLQNIHVWMSSIFVMLEI